MARISGILFLACTLGVVSLTYVTGNSAASPTLSTLDSYDLKKAKPAVSVTPVASPLVASLEKLKKNKVIATPPPPAPVAVSGAPVTVSGAPVAVSGAPIVLSPPPPVSFLEKKKQELEDFFFAPKPDLAVPSFTLGNLGRKMQ